MNRKKLIMGMGSFSAVALIIAAYANIGAIAPLVALQSGSIEESSISESVQSETIEPSGFNSLTEETDNSLTEPSSQQSSSSTAQKRIAGSSSNNQSSLNTPSKPSSDSSSAKPTPSSCTPDEGSKPNTATPPVNKPQPKPPVNTPEPTPPQTGSDYSSMQTQVLELVNKERKNAGLGALTLDSKVSNVATLKSQDMADLGYFSHTSPTYGSPFDMLKQFGVSYSAAGENIAKGQRTPQEVMDAWMNSQGHRENILNPNFTKLGVGIAKDKNGQYLWTQMFIK